MIRNSDFFYLPQLVKVLYKCFHSTHTHTRTTFVHTKALLDSWLKWLTPSPAHFLYIPSFKTAPTLAEVRLQTMGQDTVSTYMGMNTQGPSCLSVFCFSELTLLTRSKVLPCPDTWKHKEKLVTPPQRFSIKSLFLTGPRIWARHTVLRQWWNSSSSWVFWKWSYLCSSFHQPHASPSQLAPLEAWQSLSGWPLCQLSFLSLAGSSAKCRMSGGSYPRSLFLVTPLCYPCGDLGLSGFPRAPVAH